MSPALLNLFIQIAKRSTRQKFQMYRKYEQKLFLIRALAALVLPPYHQNNGAATPAVRVPPTPFKAKSTICTAWKFIFRVARDTHAILTGEFSRNDKDIKVHKLIRQSRPARD